MIFLYQKYQNEVCKRPLYNTARIMTARILLFEDEFLTGESLVFAQNNSAQEWGILIFLNLK